jgi:hypothetical protein
MYGVAEMVRARGLIRYGQDLAAQWRMSAVYVDKILLAQSLALCPFNTRRNIRSRPTKPPQGRLGLEVPKAMLDAPMRS